MDEPLVSIIIPVYKVEKYIDACIGCVLKQTYQNLEIILVDDGSPDRCGEICDEYANRDARIRVIHKKNAGLADARNSGLEIFQGDYVTFLDSDDQIAPDYIEYLLGMCRNYSVDISVCTYKHFFEGDIPEYDKGTALPAVRLSTGEALEKFFYMKIETGVGGKLFSRKVGQTIHFPSGIFYEDCRPMYLALRDAEAIAFSEAGKFGYCHRKSSQSHQDFSVREMSCVTEWDWVYRDVTENRPALLTAAASRVLSANAHIIGMMPDDKFPREEEICWKNIKALRGTVLLDPKARKKAWCFALLSYSGKKTTLKVGKRFTNDRGKSGF